MRVSDSSREEAFWFCVWLLSLLEMSPRFHYCLQLRKDEARNSDYLMLVHGPASKNVMKNGAQIHVNGDFNTQP